MIIMYLQSHYHVVFFDKRVSRAWISLINLRPFSAKEYNKQLTVVSIMKYVANITFVILQIMNCYIWLFNKLFTKLETTLNSKQMSITRDWLFIVDYLFTDTDQNKAW